MFDTISNPVEPRRTHAASRTWDFHLHL